MATCTLISSSLTSFRLRVLRIWKGNILFFSRSHATASQSMMKDFVVGFNHYFAASILVSKYEAMIRPGRSLPYWVSLLHPDSDQTCFQNYDCIRRAYHLPSDVSVSLSIPALSIVSSRLTCARSPSYLNSQVKLWPSNLSKTSLRLFVGCASIGFRGIPDG